MTKEKLMVIKGVVDSATVAQRAIEAQTENIKKIEAAGQLVISANGTMTVGINGSNACTVVFDNDFFRHIVDEALVPARAELKRLERIYSDIEIPE